MTWKETRYDSHGLPIVRIITRPEPQDLGTKSTEASNKAKKGV
jgi:hypothetical protein